MAAPGNRIGKKEKNEDFYKAILLLKDEEVPPLSQSVF